MNRNPSILARLFGRSESPLVAQVMSHAIGQPLLVHPQIGEQLVGAYLQGAVDARPATAETIEIEPSRTDPIAGERPARNIAVLNVSGGLVNRPAEGMCDPGPVSYARLRQAFDAALADPTVEAVVLRLDSPGGMASGCFDLTDHIASRRGEKPIYAMVDDYAYSAAYAIAAAADEVWLTRTGGVGSIGVIAYHYDQSGWDAKIGLKVTAIFAGDRKNDGSPHEPLADDVREQLQQRINGLRLMFAESVAKYRGMDLQAVIDTEAACYTGDAAIAAGLADRLGTWHELVAHIASGAPARAGDTAERGAPATDEPRTEAEGDTIEAAAEALAELVDGNGAALAEAAELAEAAGGTVERAADGSIAAVQLGDRRIEYITAEQRTALDRAAITDAVLASSLPPALIAALQRSPVTAGDVHARIAAAQQIASLCVAARLPDAAADYVQRGTDVETVRTQLQAAVASVGPEIDTTLPSTSVQGRSRLNPTGIYERRAKRQ